MSSKLDEWIKKELTVDMESELAKHKERIKPLLKLTNSGNIIITDSSLNAKQKIIAYMIGKVYANFAEYADKISVTNKELIENLHIREGTVKAHLFNFRNEGIAVSLEQGVHQINIEEIGVALDKHFQGR